MVGDNGLQILRFLHSHVDKSGKASYVGLQELLDHFDLPVEQLRDEMMTLEADGYVKVLRSFGGSNYLIIDEGRQYVIQHG